MDVKLLTGGHYAEIYSTEADGIKYSLLNPETFEGLHFPTFCKDFFTDVFYAETTGRPTSIWGFNWKQGMLPKGCKRYEMALQCGKKPFGQQAETIAGFLNAFEDRMEIPRSIGRSDSTGKLVVIQFDAAWTVRPVMISLLTFLMRLAPSWTGGDIPAFIKSVALNGNPFGMYDKETLGYAKVLPLLLHTFETGKHPHPKQTFRQYTDPHGCHHGGGFAAYTAGIQTG